MPETEEIIRACLDTLSDEQEYFATHLHESLSALEAYREYLDQWQEQLTHQWDETAERARLFEEQRHELADLRASDLAMSAELEQAQAEVESLREQMQASSRVTHPAAVEPPRVASNLNELKSKPSADTLDMGMNSVAKQFHKLRQQQAARRSIARTGEAPK